MKLCRNCEHWYTTQQWRGNCKKERWEIDKWSQSTDAGDCPHYVDKLDKYRQAVKVK
jgi:hypothetical protein